MKPTLTSLIFASMVLTASLTLYGGELNDWITKLSSAKEAERGEAIQYLLKQGADGEKALVETVYAVKLEPQPLALARKLAGDLLIRKSTLKPIDLKTLTPFGENKEKGEKGDPRIMLDKEKKIMVMEGNFALDNGPLEYLVVSKGPDAKLHETIAAIAARPRDICYALLACEYTYAGELGADGKINLPKDAGVMISVEFDWEEPHANFGAEGAAAGTKRTVRVPLEFFAWNEQTEKPMKRAPYAFTGSKFEKDAQTGKPIFMADIELSIAALKLDQYAVMNTPLDTRDIDPQHSAGYSVNLFVAQKRQSPCRIVFEPWTGEEFKEGDLSDKGVDKGPAAKPVKTPDTANP